MPVLKFLCPTTRAYFDSGVRLDERSAAASRLNIVRVRCLECRREHRFLLADGVLDSPGALVRSAGTKKPRAKKSNGVRKSPRRRQGRFGAPFGVEKTASP